MDLLPTAFGTTTNQTPLCWTKVGSSGREWEEDEKVKSEKGKEHLQDTSTSKIEVLDQLFDRYGHVHEMGAQLKKDLLHLPIIHSTIYIDTIS